MSSARAWRLVLPTDVTGVRGAITRLADARDGAQMAPQLIRPAERRTSSTTATMGTGPDTGNGGQMPHVHVGQRWLEQRAVDIDLLGERGEESRKALST